MINTEEIRQRMLAGTTDLNQINQWIDEFNRLIEHEKIAEQAILSAQQAHQQLETAREIYAEDLENWKASFNNILLAYTELSRQQTEMVAKVSELVSVVTKHCEERKQL